MFRGSEVQGSEVQGSGFGEMEGVKVGRCEGEKV
jgi:hypothetical protein